MLKYMEIVEDIKKNIPLWLGEKQYHLPAEKELGRLYGASRQTVRKALGILEQENLIQKKQGSGSRLTGLYPDAHKNNVSILVSTDREGGYPALIYAISRQIMLAGFSCSVHLTGGSLQKEREILTALLQNPPRGLICEGCRSALPNPSRALYVSLHQSGTEILFLFGIYPDFPPFPVIKEDNYRGGYMLAEHLIRNGHLHIGGIFRSDTAAGRERYFGYLCALRDHHLPLPGEEVFWFDGRDLLELQKKQDTSFLQTFLSEGLASCSSVICHDDEIAYHLMHACRLKGLRVSEDLSIVCFDDHGYRHPSAPVLSALTHPSREIPLQAASLLLSRFQGSTETERLISWQFSRGNTDRRL